MAPGLTLTDYVRSKRSDDEIRVIRQHQLTPDLGGKPDDIASIVAFLASDDAAFITAQTIHADGALISYLPMLGHYE